MHHFLTRGTGNDPDEDSDREPEPAPKVAEKTLPRSSKRNAPDVAPSESRGGPEAERGGRGGRRGGYSENEDGMSIKNSVFEVVKLHVGQYASYAYQVSPKF